MDQTKNNLDRIRAFDAEEGEWRTINGAHVLIKNGRIAGGAGGALNRQPFRGGSLKKMQSGSKGMESGAYGRKLKSQAKEVAEKNRAAMARANARYDRNHEARVKQMGNLMAEASKLPDHSPLEARYRNAYEALVREDQREGRATAATNHALNQEMFDLEGKSAHHESNRGEVASRAQRALERYRKSREAERGGSTSPKQSAAYNTGKKRALEHIKRLTNEGHEDPEALAAVKAEASDYVKKWRDIAKRNPGDETAEKQLGWYETLEKGWGDMLNSVNRSKSREAERGGSTSPKQSAAYNTGKKRALEHIKRLTNEGHEDPEALAAVKAEASDYVKKWRDIAKRNPGDETAEKQLGWYETLEKGWGDMLNSVNRSKSRGAERGGTAAPQQSAPHATKLGRMQPGSTAVNAGKEAKRLDHNARVYHRTARRAREAYNAKMDKAGGEPNAIEQKKNAYKAKSDENVIRRDQAAASAKGRIAKLRQLAKSLKARNPNAFKG